jgi:hypothetical protein
MASKRMHVFRSEMAAADSGDKSPHSAGVRVWQDKDVKSTAKQPAMETSVSSMSSRSVILSETLERDELMRELGRLDCAVYRYRFAEKTKGASVDDFRSFLGTPGDETKQRIETMIAAGQVHKAAEIRRLLAIAEFCRLDGYRHGAKAILLSYGWMPNERGELEGGYLAIKLEWPLVCDCGAKTSSPTFCADCGSIAMCEECAKKYMPGHQRDQIMISPLRAGSRCEALWYGVDESLDGGTLSGGYNHCMWCKQLVTVVEGQDCCRCERCQLVVYCCKQCRENDSEEHGDDCLATSLG